MIRMLQIVVLALIVAGGVVLSQSAFMVNQVEQALVLRLGEPVETYNEFGSEEPGLKFKIPFVETVQKLDKRNLVLDSEVREITAADQQRLLVDVFARFRISDPLQFYQRVNNLTQARSRLEQILNASTREVLGTVNTPDIISGQRAELMQRIQRRVEAAVARANLGVEIIDVKIRSVELPLANRQRVFARMIAERNQEAQGIRAEGREEAQKIRSDADRQSRIIIAEATEESEKIRGQGDAKRNEIYAKAYELDPDFFAFYRSMVAYEIALQSGTSMVLSPDSDFFRFFGDQSGTGR